MKQFTVEQLAVGIRERHVGVENARLVEKWGRTGLLRGLDGFKRESMARLLENQMAQVLRESNAISNGAAGMTASGQLTGFANIAFPIVRRVFGGLVANELVSIQPMSLPSGLIFYLDYTYGTNVGGDGSPDAAASTNETYTRGDSIYNGPAGKGVRSGSLATGGMYDLMGSGYTRVHSASHAVSGTNVSGGAASVYIGAWTGASEAWSSGSTVATVTDFTGTNARWAGYDSQIETDLNDSTLDFCFVHIPVARFTAAIATGDTLSVDQIAIWDFASNGSSTAWGANYQGGSGIYNLRRHNKRGDFNGTTNVFTSNPLGGSHYQFLVRLSDAGSAPTVGSATRASMALADNFANVAGDNGSVGTTLTVPSFETNFAATPSPAIPEIDIKIESVAVTTTTRKLRARWSPELAQDLNAYHSLDAEVELTQILSEQIALEIDREVLNDLLMQANGASLYWSRAPGKFVNKTTGVPVTLANSLSIGPSFTGNVREWYETLIETIIDAANTVHRKTLRGSANFIVTSPDVCTILEASVLYKPKYTIDGEGQVGNPMTLGAEPVGTLSNRFTVYKDPYFPRNKILVGYKGGSYLETGYVYAPYVPLIMTPTIFRPEDFAPTRGVMTRYGRQMIRSDFYAVVTVTDMNII